MENNLRKHILSNYVAMNGTEMLVKGTVDTASNEISDPDEFRIECKGPTVLTENVENSDVDEFAMHGPTQITKSVESSDPDGFVLGEPTGFTHSIEESDSDEFSLEARTLETRATETSDPDELYMGPTKQTFTIEASGEDEFLLM